MAESEVVKLQAQLLKLQNQYEDLVKDRDQQVATLNKVRELNKRGGAELTKASEIIQNSKDARALQTAIDERDMYVTQLKQLQEIMRGQMEEIENLRKAVVSTGANNNEKKNQSELQERINTLRTTVKTLEKENEDAIASLDIAKSLVDKLKLAEETGEELAVAETSLASCQNTVSEIQARLATAKSDLSAAEEEAEDSASAAIKATRARERAEREHREKISSLETIISSKESEIKRLSEESASREEAHSRDLEMLLQKMSEKEQEFVALKVEFSTLKAEGRQAADNAVDLVAQIEQLKSQNQSLEKQLEEKARQAEEDLKRSAKDADKALSNRITERENEFKRREDEFHKQQKEFESELKRLSQQREKEQEKFAKDRESELKRLQEDHSKQLKERDAEHSKQMKERDAEHSKQMKERETELKRLIDENLRQSREKESDLERQLKERMKEVEKLQQAVKHSVANEELSRKLEAANAVVAQLTQTASTAERAQRLAEEDAAQLRERLIKREQRLAAVQQERAALSALNSELARDAKSTGRKLERLLQKHDASTQELSKLKDELAQAQSELKRVTKERDALQRLREELQASLSAAERELRAKGDECAALEAQSEERQEAIVQLEDAVSAAHALAEQLRSDYLIATKVVRTTNHELKVSLNAERRRVVRLERDLARQQTATANALAQVERLSQNTSGAETGPGGQDSPSLSSQQAPHVLAHSASSNALLAQGSTAASVKLKSSLSARLSKSGLAALGPIGGGDAGETVKMLGTRLQDVLAESEVAREKVKMLEGIVRDLSEELSDKKRLLKELTSSSSPGQSAGGDVDKETAETLKSAKSDPLMLEELLKKAMDENQRLKRDMRMLGSEVLSAQEKAKAAEAEAKVHSERAAALLDARKKEIEAAKRKHIKKGEASSDEEDDDEDDDDSDDE